VSASRFGDFQQWLREHEEDYDKAKNSSWVLLCDAHGALRFQRNVFASSDFAGAAARPLHMFALVSSVRSQHASMASCYGNDTAEAWASSAVVSAATTLGTYAATVQYTALMSERLSRKPRRTCSESALQTWLAYGSALEPLGVQLWPADNAHLYLSSGALGAH